MYCKGQRFSNDNVQFTWASLLKCRFWFSWLRWSLRFCFSNKLLLMLMMRVREPCFWVERWNGGLLGEAKMEDYLSENHKPPWRIRDEEEVRRDVYYVFMWLNVYVWIHKILLFKNGINRYFAKIFKKSMGPFRDILLLIFNIWCIIA